MAPAPAAPNRHTMLGVPAPTPPPVITAVLPAELVSLVDPTLRIQDLSRDRLLMPAPRVQVDKLVVPAVGGIPIFVKLGQGGMGAVYYGVHAQTRSGVAVKVVPVAAASPEALENFQTETQIASTIVSPHLVPVKDQGKQDGLFYIVSEYIPGVSAGAYLRQATESGDTGLPEAVALDLCIAAAMGLADAHKNGIIHGDIRPENILIPRRKEDGKLAFKEARVADLGLPRVEDLGGMLVGSSATIGTPGYMAPEQAADAKASRKPSDVFSLGATLYALLTGRPPFADDNPMNVIMHTVQTPHAPVSKMRKDVSPATS
ncbi:MAG: serine/threonine-protein kinase, partial [Planctomycetota bacterium]|nr:serine/threonine-protein kinase [Planctomycetota bacterium]